jgi:hypothetical protein
MRAQGLVPGFIGGVIVTWLLDPNVGHRRRALVRDKLVHYNKKGAGYLGKAGRDLSNRVRGTFVDLRSGETRHRVVDRWRPNLRNPAPGQVLAGGLLVTLVGSILGTARLSHRTSFDSSSRAA